MEWHVGQGQGEPRVVHDTVEGVWLVPFVPEHADMVSGLVSRDREHFIDVGEEPIVKRYGTPEAFRRSLREETARRGFGIWAAHTAMNEMVGGTEYWPQKDEPHVMALSYWVYSGHTGHRYAARSVRTLVPHIFAVEPECSEVWAWVRPSNGPSRGTLVSAHLQYAPGVTDQGQQYMLYTAVRGRYPLRDIY